MKKALIVFPDEWIAYSPSILNSIALLQKNNYECYTIAFSFKYFNKVTVSGNCKLIHINETLYKILSRLKVYNPLKYLILLLYVGFYKLHINQFDIILGIDNIGYSAAKTFYKNSLFFSLEVNITDYWKKACKKGIGHLIIQSQERANYLATHLNNKPKITFLQNAPMCTNIVFYNNFTTRNKNLIYWGNVESYYNIDILINCVPLLSSEYTLTLRGIKNERYHAQLLKNYADLINSNRLILNYDYIQQDEIINLLQNYYIGFAMYDFNKLKESNFNFISSPSGKQFNYMAATVPTVAQKIIGFKPIAENNAGILLNDFNTESILKAIKNIESNYELYCNNAYKASQLYNFETSFDQLIDKK